MIFADFDPSERYLCSIAAAILGAGALGAAGTTAGALIGSSAQRDAAKMATNAQMSMFNTAKGALDPTITAGQNQLAGLSSWIDPNDVSSPLNALMKLVTPGANMSETLSKTPGFQFTEDRGLRSVNNALAARGLGGSGGAVAKGASEYTTGLASGTWQSVVNALQNLFTSGAGAKQNLVNTGAGAASSLTGAATGVGGQIGSNLIGAGNATAGAVSAIGGAAGQFGNSMSTAAILQKLMGGGGSAAGSAGLYGGSPDTNQWLNPATYGNTAYG